MFNLASRARPHFGAVVLTAVLLTAGGIYSATRMPSSVYPEVTFPRVAVVAKVPGLAVPNMEVQVTRPLEQAVSTVLGVARVRSKTIRGASEISSRSSGAIDPVPSASECSVVGTTDVASCGCCLRISVGVVGGRGRCCWTTGVLPVLRAGTRGGSGGACSGMFASANEIVEPTCAQLCRSAG